MMRLSIVLLLVCTLAMASTHVHAHAVLIEAQPADGAVLAAPPTEITLRFNEPVAPVAVRVLDVDARRVSDGAGLVVQDGTLRLPLPRDLARGIYVISYRVLSADSHPVGGSLMFTVGEAGAARAEATATRPAASWTLAYATIRAIFVAALLLAAGGVLALGSLTAFDARAVDSDRRFISIAATVALVAGLLSVGVKGAQLIDAGAWGLFESASWRLAAGSSLATSAIVAILGLAMMLSALPRLDARGPRGIAVIGSLMAVGSFGLTGHAATAAPKWLATPSVALHVLCAAFWLGALRPLLSALRREPAVAAARFIERFSTYAVFTLSLLLGLGSILAVLQVRHWAMLWQSPYGLVLSAKLGVVTLLLALACCNKWILTPRLRTGTGASPLRASILAEYGLFALVLALTAALTQLEPPRASVDRDYFALESGHAGFSETREGADYRVTLSVSPARTGHNAIGVMVTKPDGTTALLKEVALELSLPAAGVEPMRHPTVREPSGQFVYHGNELALAGRWRIGVRLLVDDFTEKVVTFELPIR
jgi:copper transport protein